MARRKSKILDSELLNFNSFQDRQIDILNSISKSFESSLEISSHLKDDLSKISDSIKSMIPDQDRSEYIQKSIIGVEKERVEVTKDSNLSMRDFSSRLRSLASAVAETSNKFSQISNDIISLSGESAIDVRESRDVIVHDIIAKLNKETGGFYNSEQSYQKMLNIARQADIGSLEIMEAITRPMLLASESMNVDNAKLASLFSKWYTRYNFSSSSMETMLDDIRGNTAGNNALEQASVENIAKFTDIIGTYVGGDEEKMLAMTGAISEFTSRMESNGLNSGYFIDLMSQMAKGDLTNAKLITNLLSGSGISLTDAVSRLISGDADSFLSIGDAMISGMDRITNNGTRSPVVASEVYRAIGLDPDMAFDYSAGRDSLLTAEEFRESTSGAISTVDAVDSLYMSQSTRLENWLSRIAENTASVQETLHVGIDDMVKIGTAIYAVVQLRNISGSLSGGVANLATSGGGMMATLKGVGGGLLKYAAPAAGVLAGGLLVGDGISTIFDEGANTAEKALASTGAGLGLAGSIMTALNATNPVGWAVLAAGGMAYLGKTMAAEANGLSGNARVVADDLEAVGKSLQIENDTRLKQISDLNYQFNKESDIENQRQLLLESGLFKSEDIQDKNEEQLQAMINSYINAASAMDTVTDNLLKTAEKSISKEQDRQQKDFISELMKVTDNNKRLSALELMSPYIQDEKILDKISKAGGTISDSEWKDILSGGKNAWFDSHTLTDQALDVNAMRSVDGLLGIGNSYIDSKDSTKIASYYQDLQNAALLSKSLSEFDSVIDDIESSGLMELFKETYGNPDTLRSTIKGYATGSNYISHDQLAMIHEGEAIVPKKYNPSANSTELEMLRAYYRDNASRDDTALLSSLREFTDLLTEIKDFLKYWKDDSAKRDSMKERSNRLAYSTSQLSRYRPL